MLLCQRLWQARFGPLGPTRASSSAKANLAVNARDAIPQGLKLVVETRDTVFDDQHTDQVLEALGGPSVLEILRRGDHVDLVFTDLIMPAGSGDHAHEMRPGIRVLVTSGYPEELVQDHDLQRERLEVSGKPYQQAEVVAAIRDVLRDTSL